MKNNDPSTGGESAFELRHSPGPTRTCTRPLRRRLPAFSTPRYHLDSTSATPSHSRRPAQQPSGSAARPIHSSWLHSLRSSHRRSSPAGYRSSVCRVSVYAASGKSALATYTRIGAEAPLTCTVSCHPCRRVRAPRSIATRRRSGTRCSSSRRTKLQRRAPARCRCGSCWRW